MEAKENIVNKCKVKDSRSLLQKMLDRLDEMADAGIGTSKHEDKISGRGTKGKIYSYSTLKTYKISVRDFCRTIKQVKFKANGHSPRTFEEAKEFVPMYLEILKKRPGLCGREHTSPWTVWTRYEGIAKVLELCAEDYDLPLRERDDIRRSRNPVSNDKHFSEKNNADLITFCKATGLRNAKELQTIRGTDLVTRADGRLAIHVKGKGGREREAGLYGSFEEIALVYMYMYAVGSMKVWPHVHSGADVHSFRADYAIRVYNTYARDPYTLPFEERYCCKGTKKGVWYDRRALEIAAEELGHSRPGVVANNYMYKLPDPREK